MNRRAVLRDGILSGLIWLGLLAPATAQGVGAIGGTVTDDSGAVLPGVTMTLLAPGVIGSGQTTVSDEKGVYEFTRLVPGRYSVKAELAGFQTMIHENLQVNADRTTRADMKLAVGKLEETLTVSGQAPLLDTTSALKQTPLTREIIDTVPTGRDVWSISRLAPAIKSNNYDVGGRGMMEQGNSLVHGSLVREQGYLLDGLDITSPQESAANFFFDTFTAEEINVQAGQTTAEQSKGGVLMNLISKTGTNLFRGSGMFEGANRSFESSNVSDPTLRAQLLSGVPARVLVMNPNLVPGSTLDHIFDSAANIGGPILRNRLWFFAAERYSELYKYEVGSYNEDGTQLLADEALTNLFSKVSWALGQRSQVHSTLAWNRKSRPHQNGATQTQFSDQRSTGRNDARVWVGVHRFTHVLSPRMVVDVAGAWQSQHNDKGPQPEVRPGDIPRLDVVTNTISVADGVYSLPTRGYKKQVNGSLTLSAGPHDVKFGYHYTGSDRRTFFMSVSHWPAGYRAIFRSGVPDSVETFNTPTGSIFLNTNHAAFVQDKWRVGRKLTLNLGVRYEHVYERINDGKSPICQEATPFIEGRCFPAVSGVPDLNFVSPRLSAIYDVFGDGRTALKFVANRYIMSQVGQTGLVNPIRQTSDTRTWIDSNNDLIPQLGELGPSSGFNLGTTNRLASNLDTPYADEYAAEVEQQLSGAVVVGVGYHYRGRRNIIGAKNVAVPMESYIPVAVAEVTSGQTITVFNQAPNLRGVFDVVYDNYPELDESFHGLDLVIQKRMSARWMLMASASFEQTEGDIYSNANGYVTSDLNNPNFTFRRGPSATDRPVFFKASGSYLLPYGISLAASGQWYRGLPETRFVRVTSGTFRLTQGNQNVTFEKRGTTRLDDVSTVDLKISKTWRRANLGVEPTLNIFNLFNQAAILSRVGQLGPSYGNAVTLLGAKLVKLGVKLDF